jgi:cell wall-associated NlpC family hydrolase
MSHDFHYEDLLDKAFEYGAEGPETFDCYGLCREICRRAGIHLPAKQHAVKTAAIAAIVADGKSDYERLQRPEPFCLVTLVIRKPFVSHVGVVLPDRRRFIHVMSKSKVCVERLSHFFWRKRIDGYWRYCG